jgi:gluconate 5-dehydrogenase
MGHAGTQGEQVLSVLDRFRLDGKVALITGGSRGLGLQIAEALAEAGASLAITARKEEGLIATARELEAKGYPCIPVVCDVSKSEQVNAAVAKVVGQYGHIDILVNNAGATWSAKLEDITDDAWHKVVGTNLDGTFFMSRAVGVQMMKQGKGGKIINIASVAGLRASNPVIMQTLPYNASKGAIVNFTRDLGVKLAEHNITVNAICPGFFPTKMTEVTLDRTGPEVLNKTPMRRYGGPEDLQGLALLLASDASSFITGQVIAVDGGATAL